MKPTLCFYFQIHQPVRLRKYHFFDIGKRHDYFDEYINRSTIQRIAHECYLPMNNMLLELISKYGKNLKLSFSLSGSAIDQFEMHAPEVIESFKRLAETGCVEFIAETYGHSLASLSPTDEFEKQVKVHAEKIHELFGQKPVTMRNSSLIYSDSIGERVAAMGFKSMITDGAKHVLGWKSPNFIYTNANNPKLKLLLKNSRLSDDITLRFADRSWNEWPLTAEKYISWLKDSVRESEIVNLFMNYETFGDSLKADTGIFDFMRALIEQTIAEGFFEILTPAESVKKHEAIAPLHVPYPISWSDEEKDLTGWLGNELQNEAFEKLYGIQPRIHAANDTALSIDYAKLQSSDHFYYMRTKLFSDNVNRRYSSPYDTPYEAFINYMNVLSDVVVRLEEIESRTPENKPEPESGKKKSTAKEKKDTGKKTDSKKESKPKKRTKTDRKKENPDSK